MIERHGLASENGWMPQSVAQHQRAHFNAFGMSRQPGIGDHCLIHGLILSARRDEVIHSHNPAESRALRGSCHCNQPVERHPHLWKKKMKLHSRISIDALGCINCFNRSINANRLHAEISLLADVFHTMNQMSTERLKSKSA
jgi:hypothetical protein